MAESGTFSFRADFPVVDIVTEAYERVGVFGHDLEALHLDSARRSMNLLFSEWSARGPNPWGVDQQSQVLAVDTASYNAPTGTIAILHGLRRESIGGVNTDTPLASISRLEYTSLADKTQSGSPTQFYLDRQITPVIYLWPVADVTGYTFVYWRVKYLEDISGDLSETADVPQYWLEAVCAGLASKLAVKWAPDRLPSLDPMAERAWQIASREDSESHPLTIAPDMRGYEP